MSWPARLSAWAECAPERRGVASASFAAFVSDSSVAQDATQSSFLFGAAVSESSEAQDTCSVQLPFDAAVSEDASGADAVAIRSG